MPDATGFAMSRIARTKIPSRFTGGTHIVFEERGALNNFLGTLNEKGTVFMNDKKWAVSVRTPFPHELPPET